MKGTILSVDVKNGSGVIHGENYLPYKFDMTGWNESNCYPVKGMAVQFEVGASFSACKITIDSSSLSLSKKVKNPINIWSISLKIGAFFVISIFLLANFFMPFWDDYQTKKALVGSAPEKTTPVPKNPKSDSTPTVKFELESEKPHSSFAPTPSTGLFPTPEPTPDYKKMGLIPNNQNLPSPAILDTPTPITENELLIKPVLKKFIALKSRLDIGLNFSEYVNQVGDLKVAIDELDLEPDAKKHSAYSLLKDAINHYIFAVTIWEYSFTRGKANSFFYPNDPYAKMLIENYNVPIRSTSFILEEPTRHEVTTEYIDRSESLSIIWAKADESIVEAQNLLFTK